MLKDVTRRDFFKELCSKDSLKTVFGAWGGFKKELNKADTISCDEAGLMLGRRLKKFQNPESHRKEG